MKTMIKNYLKTFILLFILLLVTSFVLTLIRFNSNISLKTLKTLSLITSSIIFLISSIINGKLNKKRGLINGVIMTSLYLITILIFKMFNQDITLSSIIIKSIVIIIGNIIGVNI